MNNQHGNKVPFSNMTTTKSKIVQPDLPPLPNDGIAACVVLLHRMLEAPTSQISVGWKNAIGPALLALRRDTPLQPFVDYDSDQMRAYGDARAATAVLAERVAEARERVVKGVSDHIEQRLHAWRHSTMNESGDRLALDDFMGEDSIDDLVDFVCDQWALDAAINAEPTP